LTYKIGGALIAAYLGGIYAAGQPGWQHAALPLMIWACLSRREMPRRFMRDWWPMLCFWLAYDSMRAWGPLLYSRVAVEAPFRWEASLFLSPTGVIWPFYFAPWMEQAEGGAWQRMLEVSSSAVYVSYLFAVPLIMLVAWLRRSDLFFQRMLRTFTALNLLGLAIYVIYPAAPPWWVYENGFIRPTLEHSRPIGFEGSAALSAIFQYSANRFGAIPSLHGAHPLLLALVLALHGSRSRWVWLAALYTASMWFATVLLNQHYIVDLLIGAALIPLSLPFALRARERQDSRHRETEPEK